MGYWIATLVLMVVFGAIGRNMADNRGRNPWAWFVICAFTSLLGVVALALLGRTRGRRDADKRRYAAEAD